MFKILILLVLGALTLNVHAGKPEWAGKEGEHAAKHESKAQRKAHTTPTANGETGFVADTESILKGVFSAREKRIIEDYYQQYAASGTGQYKGKKKELPKGLQKKLERGGELPPGWQKKLQRGEILDPQMRYRSNRLPRDLLSRLRAEDAVTEILRIQDKIIRVVKGQGTIVDIIDLADVLVGRGMRNE